MVVINSLKVPKIKKILLYGMKFLVPNYSCLQNPWLVGLPPPDPRSLCPLSSTEFVERPPPKKKFLGTPLTVALVSRYVIARLKIKHTHTNISCHACGSFRNGRRCMFVHDTGDEILNNFQHNVNFLMNLKMGWESMCLRAPNWKTQLYFFVSNHSRLCGGFVEFHIVCILLGISPASDCCMPTFRNTLSVPSS